MSGWSTAANGYTTLRALMKAYHLARKSKVFDNNRLDRGLGIAMRAQTVMEFPAVGNKPAIFTSPGHELRQQVFSVSDCSCADHKTHKFCKHRIAAMLIVRAISIEKEGAQDMPAVQLLLPALESVDSLQVTTTAI